MRGAPSLFETLLCCYRELFVLLLKEGEKSTKKEKKENVHLFIRLMLSICDRYIHTHVHAMYQHN